MLSTSLFSVAYGMRPMWRRTNQTGPTTDARSADHPTHSEFQKSRETPSTCCRSHLWGFFLFGLRGTHSVKVLADSVAPDDVEQKVYESSNNTFRS
jgi:hypothetical protein